MTCRLLPGTPPDQVPAHVSWNTTCLPESRSEPGKRPAKPKKTPAWRDWDRPVDWVPPPGPGIAGRQSKSEQVDQARSRHWPGAFRTEALKECRLRLCAPAHPSAFTGRAGRGARPRAGRLGADADHGPGAAGRALAQADQAVCAGPLGRGDRQPAGRPALVRAGRTSPSPPPRRSSSSPPGSRAPGWAAPPDWPPA